MRLTLTGREAVDVARLCGLNLRGPGHRPWDESDISPDAVPPDGGCYYLDLRRLDWFDQMRVAFTRIAAHHYLKPRRHPCSSSHSSRSVSSSSASSPA